jgi:hypothetical protein
MTMYGDSDKDQSLQGSEPRDHAGEIHYLKPSVCTGRTFKELADPNFVLPEVGLPVWWRNPDGNKLLLTNRPYLSNTNTANSDQDSTTNNWSPNGQLHNQRDHHTGAITGPGVFAGAGTQSLVSQQVESSMGSSNLGQTLVPVVYPVELQPNAFDHYQARTLTSLPDPSSRYKYQSPTGTLDLPTSVSDGNTFVPQVGPNSAPFLSHQITHHRSPVSHAVTGPVPVSNIEDQRRSPQTFSSVNTRTPVRLDYPRLPAIALITPNSSDPVVSIWVSIPPQLLGMDLPSPQAPSQVNLRLSSNRWENVPYHHQYPCLQTVSQPAIRTLRPLPLAPFHRVRGAGGRTDVRRRTRARPDGARGKGGNKTIELEFSVARCIYMV